MNTELERLKYSIDSMPYRDCLVAANSLAAASISTASGVLLKSILDTTEGSGPIKIAWKSHQHPDQLVWCPNENVFIYQFRYNIWCFVTGSYHTYLIQSQCLVKLSPSPSSSPFHHLSPFLLLPSPQSHHCMCTLLNYSVTLQ